MNVFVRSLTIAALSACSVQMITPLKQPVRASKKDLTDKRKVTVTITRADDDLNKKKKPISSSTFTKNTDGFAKKLHFDFSTGDNKITASYNDEKNKEFGIIVSSQAAPEKSEILIDGYTVTIETFKIKAQIPEQEAKKIQATVKIPNKSGWTIISGTEDLNASIAGSYNRASSKKNVHILGDKYCSHSDFMRCFIDIYANQITKIYTKETKDGSQGKTTTLTKDAIKKAGDEPVIILDDTGSARILSQADYEQEEKKRKTSLEKPIKTITATVKPIRDDLWKVVSGPKSLTIQIANKVGTTLNLNNKDTKGPDILDYAWATKGSNATLEIYQNQDTKIYAENSAGTLALHTITAKDIKKAGNKPIIVIYSQGRAQVISNDEYLSTFSRDMEARGIFIGASRKEEKEIPKTVQLKMYLASAGWRKWRSAMEHLEAGKDLSAIKKTIIAQPIELLDRTPLVLYKAPQFKLMSGERNQFDQKIKELQPLYVTIYPHLLPEKIGAYYEGKEKEPDNVKTQVELLLTSLQDATTSAQLLEEFRSGNKTYKDDLTTLKEKISLKQKIDMPNAQLAGAYLRGVNLSHANLSGAILTGADLSQISWPATYSYQSGNRALRSADLTRADLTGANLHNVNFYDATLTRTNLTNANLSGAEFTQVPYFNSAILTGADLSNATGLSDDQIEYAIIQGAKNVPPKYADRPSPYSPEIQAKLDAAKKTYDDFYAEREKKIREAIEKQTDTTKKAQLEADLKKDLASARLDANNAYSNAYSSIVKGY